MTKSLSSSSKPIRKKVLSFHPSEAIEERVSNLVYSRNVRGLSAKEKAELDHYVWLEPVMQMAKILASKLMEL